MLRRQSPARLPQGDEGRRSGFQRTDARDHFVPGGDGLRDCGRLVFPRCGYGRTYLAADGTGHAVDLLVPTLRGAAGAASHIRLGATGAMSLCHGNGYCGKWITGLVYCSRQRSEKCPDTRCFGRRPGGCPGRNPCPGRSHGWLGAGAHPGRGEGGSGIAGAPRPCPCRGTGFPVRTGPVKERYAMTGRKVCVCQVLREG